MPTPLALRVGLPAEIDAAVERFRSIFEDYAVHTDVWIDAENPTGLADTVFDFASMIRFVDADDGTVPSSAIARAEQVDIGSPRSPESGQ